VLISYNNPTQPAHASACAARVSAGLQLPKVTTTEPLDNLFLFNSLKHSCKGEAPASGREAAQGWSYM